MSILWKSICETVLPVRWRAEKGTLGMSGELSYQGAHYPCSQRAWEAAEVGCLLLPVACGASWLQGKAVAPESSSWLYYLDFQLSRELLNLTSSFTSLDGGWELCQPDCLWKSHRAQEIKQPGAGWKKDFSSQAPRRWAVGWVTTNEQIFLKGYNWVGITLQNALILPDPLFSGDCGEISEKFQILRKHTRWKSSYVRSYFSHNAMMKSIVFLVPWKCKQSAFIHCPV